MQKLLLYCCLGCWAWTLLGCQQLSQQKNIKLAHGLPVAHPVHQGMLFMAERLAEKSGGTVQIDIYPSEQLGTERQCLELLQLGALGMTKVSAAVMENFNPAVKVFSLPYLFRDQAHAFATFDGAVGTELLLGSQAYYLRGLCYYDAGARSFYAQKPILTPADLTGLKIRVQESETAIRLVNTLGGKATPIAYGELYSALQQGIVDAAENNPPSFYNSRHYEVCKHYSLNEHTRVPDILVMSTHVWNRLNEQEQTWLMESVRESVPHQRKLWAEAEAEALKTVEAAGTTIHRPDPRLFAAKIGEMMADYGADAMIGPLIQRIQSIGIPEGVDTTAATQALPE